MGEVRESKENMAEEKTPDWSWPDLPIVFSGSRRTDFRDGENNLVHRYRKSTFISIFLDVPRKI